jgi:hypothetical protein
MPAQPQLAPRGISPTAWPGGSVVGGGAVVVVVVEDEEDVVGDDVEDDVVDVGDGAVVVVTWASGVGSSRTVVKSAPVTTSTEPEPRPSAGFSTSSAPLVRWRATRSA